MAVGYYKPFCTVISRQVSVCPSLSQGRVFLLLSVVTRAADQGGSYPDPNSTLKNPYPDPT